MSFLNQSGELSPYEEVVPDAARVTGLSRSSILTQRRRCRVTPQSGQNYGSVSAGTGAGNAQIQFLIADQGGLIDPASIVLNYNIRVSGTNTVPDDGHPFTTVQILMNGQLLDNVQNAMKLTNVEMKLGGSRSYYQSAGSFQGFELLNPDLDVTTPTGTYAIGTQNSWGNVALNLADINARCVRAAAAQWNNTVGEQRSIPLGLMSGVGRMKTYLPIALLGELSLVLIAGTPGEALFQNSSAADVDYSLSQVSLEYDIVVPAQPYMALLQKVASDAGDSGLNLPFESSIVTAGGAISTSDSALVENSVIVSRATNHLLRAHVVQIPTALQQAMHYPSQSCFGHAGVWSVQFRIGSQVYPQVAAQGDASMFNMSLAAYGSPRNENGSVVNRVLWGNATNATSPGVAAVYETASLASGGTTKFAYADSFIPSYGFQTVKGASEPLDLDGVSLAGASGSQLIATIVSAPQAGYTPYVILVATKIISAKSGAVTIMGA